jgi:alpha-beta hydrolase superfamily lysophospholipase
MKKQFTFDSAGAGKIVATAWQPADKPVAVVQILHGIAEHSERYENFATYLNSLGYAVVAEDHMGHGATVEYGGVKGYFHGGWWAAIDDACALMRMTMEQYPDVPYILFGHSMGSFMARSILSKYPDIGISGCVICGTGWQPDLVLGAGRALAGGICKKSDPQKPSVLLHNIAFGSYNKRVEHPRTPYDWLTRDNAVVDAYAADPMCGFVASAGLMNDMFEGISYIQKPENIAAMRKDLPVLFVAGGDDPVGDYGKGVRKAAQAFVNAGMKQVATKIYPMGRHEILNEINKKEVYKDISAWLDCVVNSTN